MGTFISFYTGACSLEGVSWVSRESPEYLERVSHGFLYHFSKGNVVWRDESWVSREPPEYLEG